MFHRCNNSTRGFTLVELLIGLFVILLLSAIAIPLINNVLEFQQRLAAAEKLKIAKKKIEGFYREYSYMMNSQALEGRWGFVVSDGQGNSYNTVAIPLPDGTYFYSYLQYLPPFQDISLSVNGTDVQEPGNPSGLKYFVDNPFDGKMVNFRVFITPLMEDPQGRFAYRDIYLIWTKGSPITKTTFSFDGTRWRINCSPDELCVKVDGYEISANLYRKTEEEVVDVGRKIRDYAIGKYASDPSKNPLYYYLSNTSNNGLNDATCTAGTVDCYFSSKSDIANTTLAGGTPDTVVFTPDGDYPLAPVGLGLTDPANGAFIRVDIVVPFISTTEAVSAVGTPILYDNSSVNVKNPETLGLGNLGGYDALVYTCVDDSHCVLYRVSQ
ncbi:type IV pilin protein [Persephonella sp.]